ncbi:MAG: hypothetical protein V4553_02570 [Bacteroidota bacterium]
MKYRAITIVTVATLMAVACRPATQRNIFAGMGPSTKEYKQKLAKEIEDRGATDLTFTFNSYLNDHGKDYLDISIDGKGIHASSLVLINDWKKLEGIKRTKGIGYSGAELKNLKLAVLNPDTNPTFIYKDVEKIVD